MKPLEVTTAGLSTPRRVACCRLSLWVILALGVGALLLLTALSVFGIMFSSNANQRESYNELLASSSLAGIRQASNSLVSSLEGAAQMVRYQDPVAGNCSMPASGYNPDPLARLFRSIDLSAPEKQLNSMGVIRKEPSKDTGKDGWQIARFYTCPDYIYAYADPSIYPRFYGNCVSSSTLAVDYAQLAYNGTDYGLTAVQTLLFSQTPFRATFEPVTQLIDTFMLTLVASYACGANSPAPYGLIFAEQSLNQLSAALMDLVNGTGTGTAFIVERSTGFMLAASVPGQVSLVGPGTSWSGGPNLLRVVATSAPDATVRTAASLLPSFSSFQNLDDTTTAENDDLWVAAEMYRPILNYPSPTGYEGVDWVLVIAIPKTSFLGAIAKASAFSLGMSLGVIAIGLALIILFVYVCVSLPLQRLNTYVALRSTEGAISDSISSSNTMGAGRADDLDMQSGVFEISELASSISKLQRGQTRGGSGGAPEAH